MAKTKNYRHFCPVARSLEVIGEKWSLLVVRDLLRGPQRFTDLMKYLGGITPKWLTARLRELERAGIVERESVEGRREVRYTLTKKGRDLAPVVEALAVWGIEHAQRPPLPGEAIYPEQTLSAVTMSLNSHRHRLDEPATWLLSFGQSGTHILRYDGEHWSAQPGQAGADVTATITPEDWMRFLGARRLERAALLPTLHLEGEGDRIAEFERTFGIRRAGSSAD